MHPQPWEKYKHIFNTVENSQDNTDVTVNQQKSFNTLPFSIKAMNFIQSDSTFLDITD